jgi:hypothetical protein
LKEDEGGKPTMPVWVEQNGQGSEWIAFLSWEEPRSLSVLTCFRPLDEQISVHTASEFVTVTSACEIDGESAVIRIAKHAIQAVNRFVSRVNVMRQF